MNKLKVSAGSDRELVMERAFNAPRQMVFDAWTKPELVKQWLGVFGNWTLPVCEIDLRVGGTARYVWRNANGKEMGMTNVYQQIVVPELIVATEVFDDAWYPGEAVGTRWQSRTGSGYLHHHRRPGRRRADAARGRLRSVPQIAC